MLLHSGADLFTWKSLIERSAEEARAAGTPIAADYVPTALRHLNDIDQFARGATCRHKALVEYFGQEYVPPGRGKDAEAAGRGAVSVGVRGVRSLSGGYDGGGGGAGDCAEDSFGDCADGAAVWGES